MSSSQAVAAATDRGRRLRGIGLMCLALFCFALLDGSAKWLGRELPVLQITFVRYFGALILAAAVLNPWTVKDAWTTRRPKLQILRGLCLFGSTAFNFEAVRHLQLAEVMSIAFATPLIIAILAGPLLGEWIGLRRWAAIVVGFSGVLVVTRPGTAGFDPAMLWAFGSVGCYAGYSLATRMLSGTDSTASMLIISAAIPVALLTPAMPAIWVWPSATSIWVVLASLGIYGAVGHFMVIRAYALAPAPVVAPFIYTQIVWMASIGYLVYGDVPGTHTLIGAGIVIASGLYLLFRERAVTGRVTPPPATPSSEG